MKTLILPIVPFALLALAACGGEDYNDAPADNMEMTDGDLDLDGEPDDSQTGQEDRADEGLGQTAPVNAAQDMAAGPVGLIVAAVQGGDMEAYVRNAAIGNMYEIEAGGIAASRSGSEEIVALGETLVEEHTAMQEALESAVAGTPWEAALPRDLDERRQGLIDNLNAAAEMDFDAAFLHQQEAAHLEALTLHETCEARCDSEALATLAEQAQQPIRDHLEMIHDSLGAAVDGE